jgi:hypothetical protein
MTTERIAENVTFAYWVPNVSGRLVTSDIEQRTDWNYDYNKRLAQRSNRADRRGRWFKDEFTHLGEPLKPKPVNTPERPNPEIFQGGNSTASPSRWSTFGTTRATLAARSSSGSTPSSSPGTQRGRPERR